MIARMSKKISSYFIMQKIISEEDREVYEYSFEILLSILMSIIAIAVIAIVSKTVLYTTIYFAGFIPLRSVAGGFHAKSHARCFLILIVTYPLFLIISSLMPQEYITPIIIPSIIISVILVLLLAPSEEKNRPFSDADRVRLKSKSRFLISIYTISVGAILVIFNDKTIALSMTLGVLTVGLSLLANYVKQVKQNSISKAVSREEVLQNEEV